MVVGTTPQAAGRRPDRGVRIVVLDRDVLETEIEQRFDRRIELELRQGTRRARQLFARLFEMVQIEMRIAECVDEVSDLEIKDLGHHHGQKRITSDIKRNS